MEISEHFELQHRREQNDYFFFLTQKISSLHVVVNTSRGNTEEMIGFKRDSPRRLLTHFVICLNSKSGSLLGSLTSAWICPLPAFLRS